jgi:hypothetical protein
VFAARAARLSSIVDGQSGILKAILPTLYVLQNI